MARLRSLRKRSSISAVNNKVDPLKVENLYSYRDPAFLPGVRLFNYSGAPYLGLLGRYPT